MRMLFICCNSAHGNWRKTLHHSFIYPLCDYLNKLTSGEIQEHGKAT